MAEQSVRVVSKPWGHEEIFADTELYVGKILFIRAGEALSLQYHQRKDETLRVLDGELELTVGPSADALATIVMPAGAVYRVTPGTVHRMAARSDCRVLEVSTADLDDVVRLDDRYGREGTSAP